MTLSRWGPLLCKYVVDRSRDAVSGGRREGEKGRERGEKESIDGQKGPGTSRCNIGIYLRPCVSHVLGNRHVIMGHWHLLTAKKPWAKESFLSLAVTVTTQVHAVRRIRRPPEARA